MERVSAARAIFEFFQLRVSRLEVEPEDGSRCAADGRNLEKVPARGLHRERLPIRIRQGPVGTLFELEFVCQGLSVRGHRSHGQCLLIRGRHKNGHTDSAAKPRRSVAIPANPILCFTEFHQTDFRRHLGLLLAQRGRIKVGALRRPVYAHPNTQEKFFDSRW